MTIQSALASIPLQVKAVGFGLLILFGVAQCVAHDRMVRRDALWKVSWDSTLAAKKLTDDELKAAKDTLRLLVAQGAKQEADLKALFARLNAERSKVVILHDTPGVAPSSSDTVLQTDLPVVKACRATVEAKVAALSSCQLMTILMAQQHAQDSIQLRLAFRKPQPSRAGDMTKGAAVAAIVILTVAHFLHAHF